MNRPPKRKRDCGVRKTQQGATHTPKPGKVRRLSKFKARMTVREGIKAVERAKVIQERRKVAC